MLDQDPQVTPLQGWPSPHMPLVPPPSFPKAPITASASPWYLESAIRPAPRCGSMFCPCLENPSMCILQRCLSSDCPPSCILPSCPLLAHSHVENKPSYSHLKTGESLAVQWLRVHAFTAVGLGSIPDQGTKIPSSPQLMAPKEKNQTSYIPFQWPQNSLKWLPMLTFPSCSLHPWKLLSLVTPRSSVSLKRKTLYLTFKIFFSFPV